MVYPGLPLPWLLDHATWRDLDTILELDEEMHE